MVRMVPLRKNTSNEVTSSGAIRDTLFSLPHCTFCNPVGWGKQSALIMHTRGILENRASICLLFFIPKHDYNKVDRDPLLEYRVKHYQFSTISLMALAGLWMTSPAAMRFTTVSSSRRITPASRAMTAR